MRLLAARPLSAGPSPGGGLLASIAGLGIRIYQRVISPRKGFPCAYVAGHAGARSCSDQALALIARQPFLTAYALSVRRLRDCSATAREGGGTPAKTGSGSKHSWLQLGCDVANACMPDWWC